MPSLKNIPREYRGVAKETIAAYADCTLPWEKGRNIRNTEFIASLPVPGWVAADIMGIAVPHGYNDFEAVLLRKISSNLYIAREGSVCVYVLINPDSVPDVDEDERDVKELPRWGGTALRLWWD